VALAVVGCRSAAVYSAAKGGVIVFTKVLIKEVVRHEIGVICVSSDITANRRIRELSKEYIEPLVKGIHMGKMAGPEELIHGVLFVATDETTSTTKCNLGMDGGVTLGVG
jgi:NAD(P)-dependent dehydrogenase (short-subunit alcohol dehydrogenase family)